MQDQAEQPAPAACHSRFLCCRLSSETYCVGHILLGPPGAGRNVADALQLCILDLSSEGFKNGVWATGIPQFCCWL